MGLKQTHLLRDDPASKDELGTHKKIAALIKEEILNANVGRSIAIVGDWGSGKSTIVSLLQADIRATHAEDSHFFIYDAWSHQGDMLRRAFLDDFISSLKQRGLLEEAEITRATDLVWNRTEVTTTTTEPVLRRHAKWLLLSFALIPLGMELIDIPSSSYIAATWFSFQNLIASIFLLLPAIFVAIFSLANRFGNDKVQDYLFGANRDKREFSVLSFFLEKASGTVERRQIKSPTDSIAEFRQVFSFLIDTAHARRPTLRFVIIVDNIDRIPAEQARDFWSTMQTFFGDVGGVRRPQSMRYWLLTPFSIEALSFVFGHDVERSGSGVDDANRIARSYIDKTFGLTFFVPPPILANWRRYLLDRLDEAFPDHDQSDRIAVQDLFDFARASGSQITPREIKLFVNGLVALYRQRGDEVSLPAMATYLLRKDQIVGAEIRDDLLSPMERRVVDDPNWRSLLAALHFGVSPDEAAQLLLQEPIIAALREGSGTKLKTEENRPGFFDVLRKVVVMELEKPQRGDGTSLAQIASTVGVLESASKPILQNVWRAIRSRLKTATQWDGLQSSPTEGIKSILDHTAESERLPLCQVIATSLSATTVPDPAMGRREATASAKNWLDAVKLILTAVKDPNSLDIVMPGLPSYQLELLQDISEAQLSAELATCIKIRATSAELSAAVVSEISTGGVLRSPEKFVAFVSETAKLQLDWAPVIQAATTRLQTLDIAAEECRSLNVFLLSITTIGQQAAAHTNLKTLVHQGYLSHVLYLHRKNRETRASIVAAILLANPPFERQQQVEQSANGDTEFNSLVDAQKFDAAMVDAIAAVVIGVRAGSRIFAAGSANPRIERFAAAIIASMVKASYKFFLEPKVTVERKAFLEAHFPLDVASQLLANLNKGVELLKLLSSEPFQVDRAYLYLAAVELAGKTNSAFYVEFVEQGLLALPQSYWEQNVASISAQFSSILELCSRLRESDRSFGLSTTTRDALLAHIRMSSQSGAAVPDDVKDQLGEAIELLQEAQRSSLVRDIQDDIVGSTDPIRIPRIVDLVGHFLALEGATDPDRIARRIFAPILAHPTERSVEWMLRIIERRPDMRQHLSEASKQEFRERMAGLLQEPKSLSQSIIAELNRVSELLGIGSEPSPTIPSGESS